MRKLILFSARHPWPLLIVLLALTFAASLQLPHLKFNISAQSMMLEDGIDIDFYRDTIDTYGSEDVTIILLNDPALFTPEKLNRIKSTLDKIENLSFVSRTDSLFSINEIQIVDDNVQLSPYLENIPQTKEAADQLKIRALKNPFIEKNLLSPSGDTMAINVYFDGQKGDSTFDQFATTELEKLLIPLKSELQVATQIGPAYIRTAISEKITQDQQTILPIALTVLLVMLGLMLRRFSAVIIPLLTAGLSIIWTLALMATLNVPINVMTSIVPALLVIIGSTEDIHLLSEYLAGIGSKLSRKEAIDRMSQKMGLAITLTFITTYLGFLSISLNKLQLLTEFGLVASTGLLFNFFITMLLVPVLLSIFGSTKPLVTEKKHSNTIVQKLAGRLFQFIQNHRKGVISICVIILLFSLAGASLLKVNNNSLDYFGSDSPVIERVNVLQERLAGMQTFSIVLAAGIEGTFLKVRYLEEIQKIQKFLTDSGIADKTLSFADVLSLVNQAMMEENELLLPEDNDLVQEYMLLIKEEHIKGFVSKDFSEARIIVRHQIESSYELGQALEKISLFAERALAPGLKLNITGQSVLTARAADYLASAQAKSLGLMVLVILVIVSLLFVNFKAGVFAVIPNLFPIVVLFGFMGFVGIPLDTGTAMTAAIAIGICVDDTMHFMVRYHQISKIEQDECVVLKKTVYEESTPIFSTSIALAFGFGALAFSSFPPIANFGLLSALVMLLALIATFVITPLLLSYTRLISVWDFLSVQLQSEVIRGCVLFSDMRPSQIKKTILLSKVKGFAAGEVIIQEGGQSQEFFVILEGSADAQISLPDGETIKLRTMGTGQVFGEIALVSKIPRTADVIAREPLKVLVMDWDSISGVTKVYPRIAAKLFRNIATILGDRLAENTPSGQKGEA